MIPIDYPTLRFIWWILLGLLLIGFAIMDGFDLGVAMLLHRVAKTDTERRIVINTIGPVWEGNQVWLILGAGVIFAAWPTLYAVSFSSLYFAMLLVLAALILRPVGFKYRSKVHSPYWSTAWDCIIFLAGLLPALLFGVAVGNAIQGIPYHFDSTLRVFYSGHLLDLLNPFALLCGLVSISMLIMHGGIYLANKTEGEIKKRALSYSKYGAIALPLLFAAGGFFISDHVNGYILSSIIDPAAPSNPLYKSVVLQKGAWLINYHQHPALLLVPLLAFVGALGNIIFINKNRLKLAFVASAFSITQVIATVGVSMFPFILPSSSHPSMSLLIWDASSSQLTLFVMLIVTAIFLPIILLYTSWVYRVLRGKVTSEYVQNNEDSVY